MSGDRQAEIADAARAFVRAVDRYEAKEIGWVHVQPFLSRLRALASLRASSCLCTHGDWDGSGTPTRDCPVHVPQPAFALAATIVAGQAFTDADAIRVARALLDERETA